MDREEHAQLLREAIARSGYDKTSVADAVEVSRRTVSNWISSKEPTMPSDSDRAKLRRLLGSYDVEGDPVEVAIKKSRLVGWRQSDVITQYQRHLFEQDQAEAERGTG